LWIEWISSSSLDHSTWSSFQSKIWAPLNRTHTNLFSLGCFMLNARFTVESFLWHICYVVWLKLIVEFHCRCFFSKWLVLFSHMIEFLWFPKISTFHMQVSLRGFAYFRFFIQGFLSPRCFRALITPHFHIWQFPNFIMKTNQK
jgi:hypothetical protein